MLPLHVHADEKRERGRGRYAPCLFMLLSLWLPASHCAVLVCHAHTPFFSSSPPLCGIMHMHRVHACLCQCPMCTAHTHEVRRKEGRESGLFGLLLLCLCDWFLPLIHSPTPS